MLLTLPLFLSLCFSSWHFLECPLSHGTQASKPLHKLPPPPNVPRNFSSKAPSPGSPSSIPQTHLTHLLLHCRPSLPSPPPSSLQPHQVNCTGLLLARLLPRPGMAPEQGSIMSRIEQESPSLLSSQKTLTIGQEASLVRVPTSDSRNSGAFAPGPRKTKVPDSPPAQAHATNGNLLTQPGYTPRILPGGAGTLWPFNPTTSEQVGPTPSPSIKGPLPSQIRFQ